MNKRQATYLKGIAEGKSKKEAALEAGYAPSCAKKAHRVIEGPGIRREFQKIIRSWVDPEKVGQRIAEGLDAMETIRRHGPPGQCISIPSLFGLAGR